MELAQKLSRDSGFKYLRDSGAATKSSQDTGFKYLAGIFHLITREIEIAELTPKI